MLGGANLTCCSYVILVALGAIPVLAFSQGNVVSSKRKAAKVPCTYSQRDPISMESDSHPLHYHRALSSLTAADPNAYASIQQVKESREAYIFNAAQRSHGHLLENMSQTMLFMLVAGLGYPRASAGLGVGWILNRILFAYGYTTSTKPNGDGRYLGLGFWLCQAGLWGLTCSVGLKLLYGSLI